MAISLNEEDFVFNKEKKKSKVEDDILINYTRNDVTIGHPPLPEWVVFAGTVRLEHFSASISVF